MLKYFVIAQIADISFVTSISADSAINAEHIILDLGYTGKHTYGVTSALAFSEIEVKKGGYFTDCLLTSQMVSYEELTKIIETRNEVIRKSDYAEKRIAEIKKEIANLEHEMQTLENNIIK